MSRRRLSTTLMLATAVPTMSVGTACYRFQETSVASVRHDEIVHVVLRPEASVALAAAIGPNATTLDGRVIGSDATTLRLAVTQITRVTGPEEFLQGEPVDVPVGGSAAIEVRSFDGGRTFLAFGGVLAGALAARLANGGPGVVSVKGGPPSGSK